jgi:diguanylate cyclase (GGDEF)-like protein
MIDVVTSSGFVKRYLASIGLLICLVIMSVFWGFYYRQAELIEKQQLHQGQAFFQEVVLMRQWMAQHNGVYVKMTPDVSVNPYLLKVPGLRVVIKDEQGDLYTLKNPALATREISELAEKSGLFRFRITSLKPLNPANAADGFEQEALRLFEQGVKEHSTLEQRGEEVFFRYMAPLITEKSCLSCHAQQGYREGEVRGGISVTSSATETAGKIRESRIFLVGSAVVIILLILSIIYLVARSFIKDLQTAESKLVSMATRDFLTGLLNRREIYRRMEEELQRARRTGTQFSLLLLDLDHFKRVNDVHGHSAGDLVLQTVAMAMQQTVRPYDLCGRYGGEEFLVALPGTGLTEAAEAAERIRLAIAALQIRLDDCTLLQITASIGVAALEPDETIDQLVARADEAMYVGKQQGRNQVNLAAAREGQAGKTAECPTDFESK